MRTKKEREEDDRVVDIAFEYGLETTYVYPKNKKIDKCKSALIGFDCFERAERIAKRFNMSIEIFNRKTPSDEMRRTGKIATECFTCGPECFSDKYKVFTCEDYETFYDKEVKPMLSRFEDIYSLSKFINEMSDIEDEVLCLRYGQILLVKDNEVIDTIESECMRYEDKDGIHEIGLIFPD